MSSLLLWIAAASAGSVQIVADSTALTVGQTVGLTVQFIDAPARGLPDLPVERGLKLEFQSQGQQTMMVNFKTTRIVQYSYALTALSEGSWEVGPLDLTVGGEALHAAPITVKVGPRSAEATTATDLSATLSNPAPWQGEVVTYKLHFRSRVQVADQRWSPPDFDGFIQQKGVEPDQKTYTIEDGGVPVAVTELVVPLLASAPGAHTISPSLLTGIVPEARKARRGRRDDFFEQAFGRAGKQESWTAPAIPLTIRPLPKEGRPADFSGLVGRFALSVKAEPSELKLGESVTMEITLAGTGSLDGYHLPPLAESAALRVYDDAPVITSSLSADGFQSVAVFKRAVVPQSEGALQIPALRIPTFDPEVGAYRELESPALTLRVAPGDGGGLVTSYAADGADRRGEVSALGDDILPVPGDASVGDHSLRAALPLALGLPTLPLLGLVGVGLRGRLRRRPIDPRVELERRLVSLPTEPVARLAALEALFREAAALRLGRPAPGLDRAAVAPLGEVALQLYADLDAARYGGMGGADLEARLRAFILEGR